ncbi:hypothetical protein CHS0354_007820 [Potamilus streckersoni]|uniref:Uncharacterized protein n=1 Tax=Potamilus streckersoni TaxID=2493646 RepID=A0AAE0RRA3_9BIVA|nr:hypothetical protein CHS0354_007820 [Potamilus streckersoni]
MTVRCVKRSNVTCERVINGNIRIGDNDYNLRPAKGEFTSNNLLQVPDVLRKRYVLEDIENIQGENSVENEDAENYEETKLGQGSITRLRRSPVKCVKLPSQNISDLVTRVATSDNNYSERNSVEDSTRQLRKSYYVDVAVMIDSSVWNL